MNTDTAPSSRGRPTRVMKRPATGGAEDRAHGVGGHAQRRLQRREAQTVLVIQGEHERDAGVAAEEHHREHDPRHERASAEQAQVDERSGIRSGQPSLVPDEGGEESCSGDQQQQGQRTAALPGLDDREQEAQQSRPEQRDTPQVEAPPRGASDRRIGGDPASCQDDGGQADRHVDEEHETPAGGLTARGDQEPRDDGAECRARAHGQPETPEGPPPLARREGVLDEPGHLRSDHAAEHPLHDARGDEHSGGRRQPHRSAGHDEPEHRDDEHPSSPAPVAEPPADDGDESERQDVAGHHPLQFAGIRARGATDRGEGDVGDAEIQQRGELPHQQDREGAPAARIGRCRHGCGDAAGAARPDLDIASSRVASSQSTTGAGARMPEPRPGGSE
nr:hypothetical protein [uncultured Microbacterium sp.]